MKGGAGRLSDFLESCFGGSAMATAVEAFSPRKPSAKEAFPIQCPVGDPDRPTLPLP